MNKHFNLKHEVLIRSEIDYIKEKDVIYSDGDAIKYKNYVRHCEYLVDINNALHRVFISRATIIDLYNQIQEIETPIHDGTYDNLPF